MSTKIELEERCVELEKQISNLTADNKELSRVRDAYKASDEYWRKELYRNSNAWSKRYMEREESTKKLFEQTTVEAVKVINAQKQAHAQAIKERADIAALEIERARTDTMTSCFDRVAQLLATRQLTSE